MRPRRLAMLSSAHCLRIDLAELRQRFFISLKGADLTQLMRHAGSLGFACCPLRRELDEPIAAALQAALERESQLIS